jgi:cysteine desulfurase family protein (TIGR01976 family)
MTTLDIAWIRSQFPALAEQVNGKPAVFFDGPGGTQVPERVIDAISNYLRHSNANTHGAFLTSQRTDAVIGESRQAMADFLGCAPDEVMFGANMTSLTFALSRSIGRTLQAGDEIVTTRLDHDANVAPWHALKELGVVIKEVDVDVEDCTLDMADFASKITPKTKLVAVGFASNAVGTINDIKAVVKMAKAVGAMVFVDAVHYAPHGPIDVKDLDVDFLACSPYKFFAPHSGTIYGKKHHLERLAPYKVRPAGEETTERWETGTKNHEVMAGVTGAIDYLAELGNRTAGKSFATRREAVDYAMHAIQAYERELSEYLISQLLAIPGLTFYGITDSDNFDSRTPTVAIRMAKHTPEEVAIALANEGIFVWNGNYYAINLTERLGVEETGGMVRIGLVHYNTIAEVDRLIAVLRSLA